MYHDQLDGTGVNSHSQIDEFITDPVWTDVTAFTNSWMSAGSPYVAVGYCKDAWGFVHLRGVLTTGTTNTVAFTLPVGYRPSAIEMFSCIATGTGYSVGRAIIAADGTVTAARQTEPIVSLSGITFYAG